MKLLRGTGNVSTVKNILFLAAVSMIAAFATSFVTDVPLVFLMSGFFLISYVILKVDLFSGVFFILILFFCSGIKFYTTRIDDLFFPVVIVVLIFLSLTNKMFQIKRILKDFFKDNIPGYFFVAFICALFLMSMISGKGDPFQTAAFCIKSMVLVLVLFHFIKYEGLGGRVLRVLLLGGLIVAMAGIAERIIGKTFFYSSWAGYVRTRYGLMRIGSTPGNPNLTSMLLLQLLPVASYYFVRAKKNSVKILYFLLIGAYISVIFLTLSRTGMVLLTGLIFFVLFLRFFGVIKKSSRVKKIMPVFLVFLGMFVLFGLFNYLTTLVEVSIKMDADTVRKKAAKVSFQHFQENPVTGVGYAMLEKKNAPYIKAKHTKSGGVGPFNYHLKILVENGLIVFIFYVLFILSAYVRLLFLAKHQLLFGFMHISFVLAVVNMFTIDNTGIFLVLLSFIYAGNKALDGAMKREDLTRSKEWL